MLRFRIYKLLVGEDIVSGIKQNAGDLVYQPGFVRAVDSQNMGRHPKSPIGSKCS
jgi:hypothetical protein